MNEKDNTLEEQLLNGLEKEEKTESSFKAFETIGKQVKQFFAKRKGYQPNKKKEFVGALIFFAVVLGVAVVLAGLIITKHKELNAKVSELEYAKQYDETINLRSFWFSESDANDLNIDGLIAKYNNYKQQNEQYKTYLDALQAPYNYFLRYFYLPSLNIWKDDFTGELDTSIIGQKYISKNPYEDTKLHTKWTNFFKYVGKNKEFNTIDNITIDWIEQDENHPKLFTIAITIDFTSNTKRSFLLLLNKLSLTSNPENISLIDEFVYYLWKSIKEKKTAMLAELQKDPKYKWRSVDKIIGYNLYNWVKNDKNTDLIDEALLNELIPAAMLCRENETEMCYYRFREKYASLPTLAYTVGIEGNTHKKRDVRAFFSDINMLMKVENFSFDRIKKQDSLFVNNNIKYRGSMKIILYGMGISTEELEEISDKLWVICTQDPLTIDSAIQHTKNKIKDFGEINKTLETDKIKQLRELKAVLENISTKYPKYTNNQKAVKLFEIYRMLKDAEVCILRG